MISYIFSFFFLGFFFSFFFFFKSFSPLQTAISSYLIYFFCFVCKSVFPTLHSFASFSVLFSITLFSFCLFVNSLLISLPLLISSSNSFYFFFLYPFLLLLFYFPSIFLFHSFISFFAFLFFFFSLLSPFFLVFLFYLLSLPIFLFSLSSSNSLTFSVPNLFTFSLSPLIYVGAFFRFLLFSRDLHSSDNAKYIF